MSPFQQFAPALRRLGFRKSWETRAGGERMVEYTKQVSPDRTIDVQVWADGGHRASHWIRGRSTTPPTDFSTVEELKAAVEHESTRTDNAALAGEGGAA